MKDRMPVTRQSSHYTAVETAADIWVLSSDADKNRPCHQKRCLYFQAIAGLLAISLVAFLVSMTFLSIGSIQTDVAQGDHSSGWLPDRFKCDGGGQSQNTDGAYYSRAELYSQSEYSSRSRHTDYPSDDNVTAHLEEMMKPLSLPTLAHLSSSSIRQRQPVLTCYYSINDKDGKAALKANDIDPHLCTILIVSRAWVCNSTIYPDRQEDIQVYSVLMQLKKENPQLKILLMIGEVHKSRQFHQTVSSSKQMDSFVENTFDFISKHGFDGIDIDWEFPAWLDTFEDRFHYTELLKRFRSYFDEQTNNKHLLLTAAVGAPKGIIDHCYQVTEIVKYVDYLNIMTYDYHSYLWYLPFTGYNSPLFPHSPKDKAGFLSRMNLAWSVLYWMRKTVPRDKIIVGVPTFGHSYRLRDTARHGLYSLATGFGDFGGKSDGFVTHKDACKFVNEEGATIVFDREAKVPYAYKHHNWISYENELSIMYKGYWIRLWGFAGAMIYNLNSDDFDKKCQSSETDFALTRTLRYALDGRYP